MALDPFGRAFGDRAIETLLEFRNDGEEVAKKAFHINQVLWIGYEQSMNLMHMKEVVLHVRRDNGSESARLGEKFLIHHVLA